ncbi:DDB1- and CUL4-associated factor 8-like [Polyodon spathula]|uniref:DDB1- and CUL4-associated factor 8-like n=1 Tax=Polyodon spathula TaxID=7913 RepID=UPI001B7E0859|nr:DDB1- and CUL4-associated factor 8-like [Polyodon spathula]
MADGAGKAGLGNELQDLQDGSHNPLPTRVGGRGGEEEEEEEEEEEACRLPARSRSGEHVTDGSGETSQDKTEEQGGERREEEEEERDSDSMEDTVRYSLTEEAGDSDDRSGGEGGRRELRRRRRDRSRGRTPSSSDEEIEEEDEEEEEVEDEQALDEWLDSEIKELGCPGWRAIPELRAREIGRGLPHFTPRACGARGLVQRFKLQGSLEKHSGCVNTLHFNSSGSRLASGSDDLKVIIWDWTRKRAVLEFETGHKSNVFQAKFLPLSGDSTLAMCARDGQIRLADLSATQRCKSTKKVAQHKGAAHKLFFSFKLLPPPVLLNRKLVVAKENDKKVGLYTIYVNPARTHEFAVGGRDQYVRIYDHRKINENENNGVLKKFCPQHLIASESKTNITCLVYSHDGTELLASYNDEDIYLFDTSHSDGAEYTKHYKGHRNNATVKGVTVLSPHPHLPVYGHPVVLDHVSSIPGALTSSLPSPLSPLSFLLSIHLIEPPHFGLFPFHPLLTDSWRGGSDKVNCLEPHPHLPVLATSGLDHDVKIWAPTAETPTGLRGLKEVMKKNKRERDEDSVRHGNQYDTQLLWFLMRHVRQRRPQRSHPRVTGGTEGDSDESWSSPDSSDEEETGPDHVQCMSS